MPPKTTVAPRARACGTDFVSAQRVAGMNADADDVAGLHGVEIERLQRLVGDPRIAVAAGVAPARTNSQRGVMTPTPNDSDWG